MEINNWKVGYRKKGTLLDVIFIPKFLLKSHLQKSFKKDGKLRKDAPTPTLFYNDVDGVLQTVDFVRIINGYILSDDGKLYKVDGLESYTTDFKMSKGKLVKGTRNPYEKQYIQKISVTGKNHTVNEDSCVGATHPDSPEIKLLLVADGMGGHDVGKVASKMVAKKMAAAIRNKVTPILCIGEIESERAFGETADVIRDQLLGGLSEVSDDDLDKVIIAYEPVWAISSTKAAKIATPDEISEVVKMIRKILDETYGGKVSEQIPILFGGSVNSSNAGSYLTVPGVNGLLIGGASLILNEFTDIIETAKRVRA